MKTTIKSTLAAAIFLFVMHGTLQAQDKYEYAVIHFTPGHRIMEISINGTEYKKTEVPKSEVKGDCDVNPALKEVNRKTTESWEVLNTNTLVSNAFYYIFYLRKKVN